MCISAGDRIRTPSKVFPSPTFRAWPCLAAGSRADERACTLGRGSGLRARSYRRTWVHLEATGEPNRRGEFFGRGPGERELQPASSNRAPLFARARLTCCCVPRVRSSRGGGFRCGAEKRSHLQRMLWTWAKVAAIVRPLLPGSWARHARWSSCSSRSWFMRSLTANASDALAQIGSARGSQLGHTISLGRG